MQRKCHCSALFGWNHVSQAKLHIRLHLKGKMSLWVRPLLRVSIEGAVLKENSAAFRLHGCWCWVPTSELSRQCTRFVYSHAPLCCLNAPRSPTCRFCRRLVERGKVWLEQLVALATLCATAVDWNRNWPIHVSLQAGSGPCLVLTDYLISIQTARVSAPLLRSLEKRPQPASF